MKKISFLLAFFALTSRLIAQQCCMPDQRDGMQLLANNRAFQRAHPLPKPFKFVSLAGGEALSFATPDGQQGRGFVIKAKQVSSQKYLFVYQEWWGLNDHIKREAERLYFELGENVHVLALDMYDGQVATTREEAGKLMSGAKPERLEAIIKGAVQWAGTSAQIASVGWCFGGGLSLRSALIEGNQAVGCVMYYGMPEKDVEKLKNLKCDVLGLFAGKEKWISPAVVTEFDENMKKASKKLTFKIFDSEHGFANPSNPRFDKVATEEAWQMTVQYLKSKLG
jgi:carboxymethylenebutenolidase